MYKLIIDNADKGIAIMANDNGNLSAYVNGKHYSVTSYRPLSGDGRQLREDSQRIIRELLPTAKSRLEAMEAEKAKRLERYKDAGRSGIPVF